MSHRAPRRFYRSVIVVAAAGCMLAAGLPAQVHVIEWGLRRVDSRLAELSDYVAIGSGSAHSLAIRSNGSPVAWGYNLAGQCELPALPLGMRAVQVAGGADFTLALTNQGTILHCGSNSNGEGNIPPLPAGVVYRKVVSCNAHAAALRSDGNIVVWGDDSGAGPIFPALHAVPALPLGVSYTDVAIAGHDAVAVRSDGALLTWGYGVAGMGLVPPVPPGRTVVAIDADSVQNGNHALALLDDGTVLAWGDDGFGQSTPPAPPPSTTYVKIAAGALHSVALRSDGALVVWGGADPAVRAVPPLPPGVSWVDFAAGADFTIALRSDRRVQVFGVPGWAVVANCPPPPVGGSHRSISLSRSHALATRSDGTLSGWGLDSFGQATVPAGNRFTAVAAGAFHSLALRDNGGIVAWGDNAWQQLSVPALPGTLTYTAIAAGFSHGAALLSDGSAVAWGAGSGAYASTSLSILPLPAGVTYEQVSAHGGMTALLRSDGVIVQNGYAMTWPGNVVTRIVQGNVLMARSRDGLLWPNTMANCAGMCNLPTLPFGVYYVEMDSGGPAKAFVARRSDGRLVIWGQPWHRQEHVPDLPPNESWLAVEMGLDTVVATCGPQSTYVSFAQGCGGTQQPSRLIPHDTPRIGRTLAIEVDRLPQDLAVLVAGWSTIQGGASLASFGMPGCVAHVAIDATALLVGAGGWARHVLPIPCLPALVGARLHHQALVFDPGGNAFGLVVSDAATFVVGQ